MKDTWYADNRDLVKWGVLAHLAERETLGTIVQVPYLRFGPRPPLQIDNDGAVIVVPDEFEPADRAGYQTKVLQHLRTITGPKVVLLDPDTGLAPNRAAAEHISHAEVAALWTSLNLGDWLVLYQHASRTKGWREHARDRFSDACSGTQVTVFASPKLAWDVCFLVARKDISSRNGVKA
jgi:hypothetical protein